METNEYPNERCICARPAPLGRGLSSLYDAAGVFADALTHGLVLVRGWHGDEDAFVALSRKFGALERATPKDPRHDGHLFRVISRPEDDTGVGRYWHADGFAGTMAPALLTIYHVVSGASATSGTSFVDGFAAWAILPQALRRSLCKRSWVHPSGAAHPFFLRHQLHDHRALSVNLGKVAAISGMGEPEMQQTVLTLERVLDDAPRYVHGWSSGDILFVDNRRILHRAPDRVDAERLLWRASVVSRSV
jgi:alpha-ketoglutarate-dependent taurine dioxygenase